MWSFASQFRAKLAAAAPALLAAVMAAAATSVVAHASQPARGFGTIACGDADTAQGLCRLQVTITDANGNASPQIGSITPSNGSFTDCSGTITSGGTAQNAIAASTGLNSRFLLNPPSATESLWYSTTGTATINGESSGSIELKIGASVLWPAGAYVPSNALSVNASSTSHKFTCSRG